MDYGLHKGKTFVDSIHLYPSCQSFPCNRLRICAPSEMHLVKGQVHPTLPAFSASISLVRPHHRPGASRCRNSSAPESRTVQWSLGLFLGSDVGPEIVPGEDEPSDFEMILRYVQFLDKSSLPILKGSLVCETTGAWVKCIGTSVLQALLLAFLQCLASV